PDLGAAVPGALPAKVRNRGQTCVCATRLYVQDGVYAAFAAKLAAAVSALHVAPYADENAQQGPLINEAAIRRVSEHIADAVSKGATVVSGGNPAAQGGFF
ncbi:aldehyde dehydrogenase family protein, partial [Morganella morganii]|uniref:aldehyde dehydrogenase family protein n=1 Tax=Morganella morganii TaxID=582 RepID=UPI0015F3EB30